MNAFEINGVIYISTEMNSTFNVVQTIMRKTCSHCYQSSGKLVFQGVDGIPVQASVVKSVMESFGFTVLEPVKIEVK